MPRVGFLTLPPGAPHLQSSPQSREPWGDPVLEGSQESRRSPAGPGHAPHFSHPALLWSADGIPPGKNGIPSEGWRPDSPGSNRAVSISAMTGRSLAYLGMLGVAG